MLDILLVRTIDSSPDVVVQKHISPALAPDRIIIPSRIVL